MFNQGSNIAIAGVRSAVCGYVSQQHWQQLWRQQLCILQSWSCFAHRLVSDLKYVRIRCAAVTPAASSNHSMHYHCN